MINGKRIAVVMPAYNAEKTLEVTVGELPDLVDIRILVDDHSSDRTVDVAHRLGLYVFQHDRNYGYGRNQQTCYREALAAGADVVIMLHPDYQYTPLLITAMASMVAYDVYDVVLGSRIIGGQALLGGMPFYKYISNRLLTAFENLFLGVKLSEYHTGYRAFSRKVLTEVPLLENSDDFVFDNQMLAQCVHFGFRIGEVSCPTKYFEEASSINFRRSVKYGFGVLATTLQFALQTNRADPPAALQRHRTQTRDQLRNLLHPPLRSRVTRGWGCQGTRHTFTTAFVYGQSIPATPGCSSTTQVTPYFSFNRAKSGALKILPRTLRLHLCPPLVRQGREHADNAVILDRVGQSGFSEPGSGIRFHPLRRCACIRDQARRLHPSAYSAGPRQKPAPMDSSRGIRAIPRARSPETATFAPRTFRCPAARTARAISTRSS